MIFRELQNLIHDEAINKLKDFDESSNYIEEIIFKLPQNDLIALIKNIGIIPESIAHDSTEEKLYAKTADILLAKAFHEVGLFATVNKERANCADVVAKSHFHNYSLVGDAKAFRLSRTAKNQKDFKVKSMVDWKGTHDFSVLVSPYYQYPKTKSQIYGQALNGNVCLLSWEHLSLLLENRIKETKDFSLSSVWNISDTLSSQITIKDKDKNINFHKTGNEIIRSILNLDRITFYKNFADCRDIIIERACNEICFWNEKIEQIRQYTKEQAIEELIKSKKIYEKITTELLAKVGYFCVAPQKAHFIELF